MSEDAREGASKGVSDSRAVLRGSAISSHVALSQVQHVRQVSQHHAGPRHCQCNASYACTAQPGAGHSLRFMVAGFIEQAKGVHPVHLGTRCECCT